MIVSAFKQWLSRARSGNVRMTGLFWFSMAECTFVPIPLELILFPVMQKNRDKIWPIAFWVTLAALIGALVFYALSSIAMEQFGNPLISTLGWQSELAQFNRLFAQYGFWAIVAAGILPLPLQIAMLAAGASNYPIFLYAAAILASRLLRYYGIGWLVLRYGNQADEYFARNKIKFTLFACAIIAIIWAVLIAAEQVLLE